VAGAQGRKRPSAAVRDHGAYVTAAARMMRMDRKALLAGAAKAIAFLESRQKPDGHWEDFRLTVGVASEWVTGYIGLMLSEASEMGIVTEYSTAMLRNASEWLLHCEHEGGGWGFNRDSGVDADSTSNCLLFLLGCGCASEDCAKRNRDILLENQNADGGIGTFSPRSVQAEIERRNPHFPFPGATSCKGWCSSDTQVSAISTLALLRSGLSAEDPVIGRTVSFILGTQQPEGFWNAYWSNGKMLGTAFCIRALAEAERHEGCLRRAATWTMSAQNEDGSWSSGRAAHATPYDTALAVAALASCREQAGSPCVSRGAEWLLNRQLPDGSWESFPIMTVPKPWDDTPLYESRTRIGVPDHNRLFTTATVLSALAKAIPMPSESAGRKGASPHSPSEQNSFSIRDTRY